MKRAHWIPHWIPHWILVLAVCLALGAGAWFYFGRGAAQNGQEQAGGDDTASVLVTTAAVQKQAMPLSMEVFGDVVPGKLESLSFPQAGQLVRLAVVPGQHVHRGELVAILNSDPNSRVAYAQAESGLSFARRELRRNQDLLALQLATQAQVDAAAKQVQDAQAALDAQARLGGASASPQLLAPFDGVVAAAPAAQGDRLAAGAAVVQLGRSDPLRVLLAIEPSSSGALRTGMPVTLSAVQGGTPGNARAGAGAISASIAELQNVVDPKTQMAGAVLLLPAARQAGLLPGMRVYATIELGRREAWAVPRQAVLSDDKGAYLFQVAKDTAHRIDVNKLVDTGAQFGVEGPLDAALPVVVLGNYELKDGMAVRGGGR